MDSHADNLVGRTFERWTIEQIVKADGRLEVYSGFAKADRSPVTIGILPPFRHDNPAFRSRFLRECRTAAAIKSPNVARYLGCGAMYRRLWYVTDGAPLPSLQQRLDAGWQPDGSQTLSLAVQIARGVAAAALEGLTHRALHPDQITIDDAGTTQLTGFGIAPDTSGEEAIHLTHDTSQPVECLAPEQINCGPFDGRGDLYALACVIYWLGCGRPPFIGANQSEIIDQHLRAPPAPARRYSQRCPPPLSAFLQGLLAKQPSDRAPGSILDVMQELDTMRQCGAPGTSTRRVFRAPATPTTAQPAPRPAIITAPTPTPNRATVWLATLGVAASILGAFCWWQFNTRQPAADMVAPAVPTSSPPLAAAQIPDLAEGSSQASMPVVDQPPLKPAVTRTVAAAPQVDPTLVAQMLETGDHLGPVDDLLKRLGPPDLREESGGRLWYGNVEFVVENGVVLSGRRHSDATTKR